ncbi:hypothetical protein ALQ86_200215 [Pseudomonas amygdali pv. eriobotryae]|uniref:Uncharacterized protein n=1 Tax=Pseudomonas amygdali pv. eriobotryae TaxID=129137 RepID=A0A3M3AHC3_PSEA0|nr:hypothetical protein ALQ86_200215 [Pseudomonas amygdali pv. eriobotryae]
MLDVKKRLSLQLYYTLRGSLGGPAKIIGFQSHLILVGRSRLQVEVGPSVANLSFAPIGPMLRGCTACQYRILGAFEKSGIKVR